MKIIPSLVFFALLKLYATPPNMVVITLDTVRTDHLSCYGYAQKTTPTLDAMASVGVLFTHAMTPVPITLPSHASLFTGLLPIRHGIRHNGFYTLEEKAVTLSELLKKQGYTTMAVVSAFVLNHRYGLNQGFDDYLDEVDPVTREVKAEETTRRALKLLKKASSPFFLWVHYYDPHDPYEAPEPFRKTYSPYDAEIAYMDHALKPLWKTLQKIRKTQELYVVVVGDHGEMLGEHGEDRHGILLYQGAVHVPMLWIGPSFPRGKKINALVSLVDLFPTLATLAGIAYPSDGLNLLPLLQGKGSSLDNRWLFLETYYPFFEYRWKPLYAVTNGRFKYIVAPGEDGLLLDLIQDPKEQKNRISEKRELASKLSAKIHAYLRKDPLWQRGYHSQDNAILSAEEMKALQSLGYLTHASSKPPWSPQEATIDPAYGLHLLHLIEKAEIDFQKGAVDAAKTRILHVLKQNPHNPFLLGRAGNMLLQYGFPGDAAVFFQRAIRLYPASNEVDYTYLAEALAQADKGEQALQAVEKALSLNPHFDPALGLKAKILFHLGRSKDMQTWIQQVFHEDTQDLNLLYYGGGTFMAQRDFKKARRCFQRILQINPHHIPALIQLATLATEEADYKVAAQYLEKALQYDPTNFTILTQLGSLYLTRLDNPIKAHSLFERALSLAPTQQDRVIIQKILNGL